jgi:hypothetical protein
LFFVEAFSSSFFFFNLYSLNINFFFESNQESFHFISYFIWFLLFFYLYIFKIYFSISFRSYVYVSLFLSICIYIYIYMFYSSLSFYYILFLVVLIQSKEYVCNLRKRKTRITKKQLR